MRNGSFGITATAFLITAVALSGCASKRIISQWRNPAYASRASSFESLVVIGVTDQTAIRRNFEDEFTSEIKKTGIGAVPSYRFFPENVKVAEAQSKRRCERPARML